MNWNDFKNLVLAFKPEIIYYARDPHPLRKPPWGLKLIFYMGFDGYVFVDYADGNSLHKTKIPIKASKNDEIPISVKDIECFLQSQIGKVKLSPIWFVS